MIDTHAHLNFDQFDQDREEVIRRFFESEGEAIINIGVDLKTSRKSIELAEKYENIFASVGFHPHYFMEHGTHDTEQKLMELKKMAKNEKVVAIGETGLDYFSHTGKPIAQRQKENQKKGFLAQIEIAKELNLPVIVHCREAWEDLFKIIESKSSQGSTFPLSADAPNSSRSNFCKFVLHCYSGDKKITEKFLELPNIYFSFSGNITYPKPADRAARIAETVRMIPLERIMLDSDAPFLAPQEQRGKRNEPSYVKYIAQKIAEIKEISGDEVERVTDKNAIKFFGI